MNENAVEEELAGACKKDIQEDVELERVRCLLRVMPRRNVLLLHGCVRRCAESHRFKARGLLDEDLEDHVLIKTLSKSQLQRKGTLG